MDEVMDGVTTDVLVGVLIISSLSIIGCREAYTCWGTDVHTVRDIDPGEPSNISFLLASDRTQAAPQSSCLNDAACANI